jgi:hypothetical protein
MHLRDYLPLIGVVFGTLFGWLLSQLGQWFSARREEKKAIARVLSELLEIRHRLLAVPKVTELLSQYIPIPPEAQTAIKIAFVSLFPFDADISKRYDDAVSLVGACNPVLGFRLRSQDVASPFLNAIRQLSLAGGAGSAAAFTKVEKELLEHLKPHLEDLAREVAKMHGWITWWKVRHLLHRPMEIPTSFLEILKNQMPQTPQGTPETVTPATGAPDIANLNTTAEASNRG